jgi:hypothetical protein
MLKMRSEDGEAIPKLPSFVSKKSSTHLGETFYFTYISINRTKTYAIGNSALRVVYSHTWIEQRGPRVRKYKRRHTKLLFQEIL